MTAAAVAAYHPKSVRALVLEDPPACDISIVFPYVRSQMKIRAMPYEERIQFYMENGKTEEQAKKASATVDKINVPAMNELLAGKAAFDIREILPLIKCEVLFMLGNPEKGSMAREEYRAELGDAGSAVEAAAAEVSEKAFPGDNRGIAIEDSEWSRLQELLGDDARG